MIRKIVIAVALIAFALALPACGSVEKPAVSTNDNGGNSGDQAKVIRIGYQKYGTMNFLRAQGVLEERLGKEGVKVEWTEFPGGPQLLEALNVGSIDIGHTGEAPPIFAQAAGAPLVYLAHEPPSPQGEAILVPQGSPIKSVADLKGKKVALNKGSNVHYLLVVLLEKAGLQYKDVETVFLPPADARVAFERGSVDAWVIWDPFLAAAQTATKGTILADGTGVVSNHEFYFASRSFVEKNPDLTAILLEELDKVDEWAKTNLKELTELLSAQLGIDVPSLELASGRREYGVQQISEKVIAEQQRIADTFEKLGLIPKPIQVKDAVLNNK
ncbi:sulfonate ABC transporter substrate-binding protein [Paenibacillus naphthalenovorans]|uniref:sulfonate ABC transporter substrate-binding protein n=1 Tax=Paenibacillus naphthalenovorans TaxID=162209 RepID=UPI003D2E5051